MSRKMDVNGWTMVGNRAGRTT